MAKFLAVYEDADKNRDCGIYYSYEAYFKDTFCPDTRIIFTLDMSVSGRTYAERKADLQDKAIEYSNNMNEIYPISLGEINEIADFFSVNGKRYGLLTDFHENCIC